MLLRELIEGVSSRIYHYTDIRSAVSIMKQGEFQLTAAMDRDEKSLQPQGHLYFLSTTRTRHGGYHTDYTKSSRWSGVLLTLDGDFYNQRYPGKPVDFYSASRTRNLSDKTRSRPRPHEAEDRIYSRNSTIPAAILQIDVYYDSKHDQVDRYSDEYSAVESLQSLIRKLALMAKQQDTAFNLYRDRSAWLQGDSRQAVPVDRTFQGKSRQRITTSPVKQGRYDAWIELMSKSPPQKLSKPAEALKNELVQGFSLAGSRLYSDLARSIKQNSKYRADAANFFKHLQRQGWKSTEQMIKAMAQRWS